MTRNRGLSEESFLTRMIREFFVLLFVVGVLEMLVRAGLVVVAFYTEEPRETKRIANNIAADVKSLMLNDGGPVAAKTMYPILKDTYDSLGYDIAVTPAPVTVASIEKTFDFTPHGIPVTFHSGIHREARVDLRAERMCLGCHRDAEPGQVLGSVRVRSYLTGHLVTWWQDAQKTAVGSMAKILFHTVVLYLLLRSRMAPLIGLRTAVSELSKAGATLRIRAEVRSGDEFGQLAHDINLFLDRVTHISEDLGAVLHRLSGLNLQLNQVRQRVEQRNESVRKRAEGLSQTPMQDARPVPGDDAGAGAATSLLAVVEALRGAEALPPDLAARLDQAAERLESQVTAARQAASTEEGGRERVAESLAGLHDDIAQMSHLVADMGLLEERMDGIAREGERLLRRLLGESAGEGTTEAGPAGGGGAAA